MKSLLIQFAKGAVKLAKPIVVAAVVARLTRPKRDEVQK